MNQQKVQHAPYILRRIYNSSKDAAAVVARSEAIELPARVVFKAEKANVEELECTDHIVRRDCGVFKNIRISTGLCRSKDQSDRLSRSSAYFARPSGFLRKVNHQDISNKSELTATRLCQSKERREPAVERKNFLMNNRSFMNQFLKTKLKAIRSTRRDNYFQYLYNCATTDNHSPGEA